MKTQNINKRKYITPYVERVSLDNDISLALESSPPYGPDEPTTSAPEYFNNDPFKSYKA